VASGAKFAVSTSAQPTPFGSVNMSVIHIQPASWGPLTNAGDLQTNYFRVPFAGTPNITATSYLSEVSIGIRSGRMGTVVASFKRYEYLDDNGYVQVVELPLVKSFLEVKRCISITIALNIDIATGMGGWSFYYMN
jgi:hypothetical protein